MGNNPPAAGARPVSAPPPTRPGWSRARPDNSGGFTHAPAAVRGCADRAWDDGSRVRTGHGGGRSPLSRQECRGRRQAVPEVAALPPQRRTAQTWAEPDALERHPRPRGWRVRPRYGRPPLLRALRSRRPGPHDRLASTGYKPGVGCWTAGENLLTSNGPSTASQVMQAWMNSPAHRQNVLRAGWHDFGLGVARAAPRGGPRGLTLVALFGVRSKRLCG